MNKYSLKFDQVSLERTYCNYQIDFILDIHRKASLLLSLIIVVVTCVLMVKGSYVIVSFLLALLISNITQLIYFKKKPSTKCILVLNIFNLGVALARLVTAIFSDQITCFTEGFFYQGIAYITIHYALLINPSFIDNVIVMTIIFLLHQVASFIFLNQFTPFPLTMFPVAMVHLYKNYKEIRQHRQIFLLQLKEDKWAEIFREVTEQPYITMKYTQEKLRFDLLESNHAALQQLSIFDTSSMRLTMRNMEVQESNKVDLEKYIFKKISNPGELRPDQVECIQKSQNKKNQNSIFVKFFQIDTFENSYLLIFKMSTLKKQLEDMRSYIISNYKSNLHLIQLQFQSSRQITSIIQRKPRSLQPKFIKAILDLTVMKSLNFLEILPFNYPSKMKLNLVRIDNLLMDIQQIFMNYDKMKIRVINSHCNVRTNQDMLKLVLVNIILKIVNCNKQQKIMVILDIQKTELGQHANNFFLFIISVKNLDNRFLNIGPMMKINSEPDLTQNKRVSNSSIRDSVTKKCLTHIAAKGDLEIISEIDKKSFRVQFYLFDNCEQEIK